MAASDCFSASSIALAITPAITSRLSCSKLSLLSALLMMDIWNKETLFNQNGSELTYYGVSCGCSKRRKYDEPYNFIVYKLKELHLNLSFTQFVLHCELCQGAIVISFSCQISPDRLNKESIFPSRAQSEHASLIDHCY